MTDFTTAVTAKIETDKLYIIDVTLSAGEQATGVVFARSEKVRIARLLDELGIPFIEVGMPGVGAEERDAIQAVAELGLKARLSALCSTALTEIEAAAQCGVHGVTISISTSDIHLKRKLHKTHEWVLERTAAAVEEAKRLGLTATASAEDATRTDFDFLVAWAATAKKAGADRLRLCDTVSTLDPFRTFRWVQSVRSAVDIDLELHTHNDFGMATANLMGGVRAGADYLVVAVNGLGERAGNAALEEVVMALKHPNGVDLGIDTTRFRELAEYVSAASGRPIPIWKAVVGNNVFTHESGIHVDGVIKNPRNYEVFQPEEVGLLRQLLVGKHSGSHTLIHKFREFGIELTAEDATAMLAMARASAVELKRALFDKELMYIYNDYLKVKKNGN
jgi:homocitrate synthase NifV